MADGGEAVVRGDEDIGILCQSRCGVDVVEKLLEVSVSVLDGRFRGRAIDAWGESVQAVALVVLGTVCVARPEEQRKGTAAGSERRQDRLSDDIGEILLLNCVRRRSSGRGVVS